MHGQTDFTLIYGVVAFAIGVLAGWYGRGWQDRHPM